MVKNPRSRRSAHEPAHPLPGLIEIAHKTIGIVAVAAFAASGETPPPVAAITATLSPLCSTSGGYLTSNVRLPAPAVDRIATAPTDR
jgi:hypothetical protein